MRNPVAKAVRKIRQRITGAGGFDQRPLRRRTVFDWPIYCVNG